MIVTIERHWSCLGTGFPMNTQAQTALHPLSVATDSRIPVIHYLFFRALLAFWALAAPTPTISPWDLPPFGGHTYQRIDKEGTRAPR